MAALKIQFFYRQRLLIKRIREQERQRRELDMKKGEVFKSIIAYILKVQYRKMRLRALLSKLVKMFKEKRKRMVLDSVILIQYHTRQFLKKLAIKRELARKQEQEQKKRKSRKKGPAKYRIVNRGGKIMRINILEEKRKKEEQRKVLEKLANTNKDLHISGLNIDQNEEDETNSGVDSPQTNHEYADHLLSDQFLYVILLYLVLQFMKS